MVAALALGAEGVWMGTRFIASTECPWHDNYKQAIVDTDQVIGIETTRDAIPNLRAVRTPFAEAWRGTTPATVQSPTPATPWPTPSRAARTWPWSAPARAPC